MGEGDGEAAGVSYASEIAQVAYLWTTVADQKTFQTTGGN